MPKFNDDLFLGTAVAGGSFVSDGSSPMTEGVGPLGRVYVFDTVPLTLQVAGLAASQNPGSGASFTLAAGTGVTASGVNGETRYVLDVPRSVTIKATGANTATYTVTGYDVYGQKLSQTVAAPSTSTVSTTKMFKSVISVTNANATAGTNGLEVGYGDSIGLPIKVSNLGYVTSFMWDQAAVTINSTNVKVADATSPATTTTTDVRGYLPLTSAADGTKRLVMSIAVPGVACGPNATRVGAFGVTQNLA